MFSYLPAILCIEARSLGFCFIKVHDLDIKTCKLVTVKIPYDLYKQSASFGKVSKPQQRNAICENHC